MKTTKQSVWIWSLVIISSLLLGSSNLSPARALDDPEGKITAVVKEYISAKNPNWAPDEIRVTYKAAERTMTQLAGLPAETKLKVLDVDPEFKPAGNVIFPLQATYGAGSVKFLLRAKVEIVKPVAVAAALIKKGQAIGPTDLRWVERDVALLPQKYFLAPEQLLSQEAKIAIPENSTIFEWMVGAPPLLRGGQEVTLVANATGLTVRAKGQALSDGHLGEVIQVRRIDANKVLSGKVVSATEIEVNVE
jgi:flagella basal body P-ring formation protein FlgA